MRDVKDKYTRVHLLSAFLRAKSGVVTNESEASSLGSRRISAYVRVVVLGVLRRAVFWAGKSAPP